MDERQLARIRFVTERFRELQGLRELPGVATAAVFCAGFAWRIWVATDHFEGSLIFMGVAVTAMFVSGGMTAAVDNYYRRRFGKATAERQVWTPILHLAAFVAALAVDVALGHAIPAVTITGAVSVPLFVVVRDWPWRTHQLLNAVGMAVGGWILSGVFVSDQPFREEAVMGLACIVAGRCVAALFDHALLARVMRARNPIDADAL